MRKPLLSLAAVAIATAAGSGGASTNGAAGSAPQPPAHGTSPTSRSLRPKRCPPSDALHRFLDLLDRLARIER
jgi:hypothetical protein